ncbi:MAG: NADH-quinone oxidoreductase subunit M [Methylococcales bacterium]|nr:NADH-quinone oxidoreductase subunit M [Methylococcales bacterium]
MLIGILFAGGLAAWFCERLHPAAPARVALTALAFDAVLLFMLYPLAADNSAWIADLKWQWIPRFGIGFHLAMDGVSLLLVTLAVLLGCVAVGCARTEIRHRQGFFYFNLLFCLAGAVGVFLAMDLFLFFFCWELMLAPMYFLIGIWGHEDSIRAAIKFFIFTQVGGLLMLLAIVALALIYHADTGRYSFDYFDLLHATPDPHTAFLLMLGFFVAFSVKLPAIPFHAWLPDAHTQAPTAGSVILAGVMLKTGAYGLLRFTVPLFPDAAQQFAPVAMTLGAISVLYGAVMAYAQSDLKRLIAYTSISHMGFMLLGIFSLNLAALQGSVVTMLAHGFSAAALFMIAGALQERLHTREMGKMGGLWPLAPRLSAITLFFAIASLGLPGLGNFIGEFLVLLGTFKVNAGLTALTALVLILAPAYALLIVRKTLHGPLSEARQCADFGSRQLLALAILMLATLCLGLHPQPVLDLAQPSLLRILQAMPPET